MLTAAAGVARIEPTRTTGGRVRVDTAFRIRLDRPLDPAAVKAALRSEPAVHGDLAPGATPGEYVFTPWSRLAPGTAYRLWLDGLTDADGVPFETAGALAVRTAGAPGVVRFRPRSGTDAVDRLALLSVRFTQPMNRAATAAAFHVTAAGHPVAGTTSWAEGGEVLVFRPAAALAYGADVVMTVDGGARSRTGAFVAGPAEATFTVAARPKPKTGSSHHAAAHRSSPGSRPIHHSGGGGAVSGSWHSVEAYYLRLMNCTRTGGWVTSKGNCSSPGGRSVAPLSLSSGISTRVSRPYAKLLASHGWCDHFIGGSPGDRLRHAGYRSYRWAENLGCRSGNPYSAVLGSHLYFQSERPYNGGHYRNLMNAAYDRVGIGVWVAHRNVRLVVDFYHP